MKRAPRRLTPWLLIGIGLMLAAQVAGAAFALANHEREMLAAPTTTLLGYS